MDALILAGGATPPELAQSTLSADRALIEIGGRAMLDYVLDAVRATRGVERIAIVGSSALREKLNHESLVFVNDTGKMMGNAVAGVRALDEARGNRDGLVLITTCDIPLVSPQTFDEFIEGFNRLNLEGAYALVKRPTCETQFPGGKRTYAHLADGDYTAGNAVIVRGEVIEKLADVFERFYRVRKNPLAMAKIFGGPFLWKAVTRKLSVQQAEAKLSELAGCRAGAVVMNDASIAFDVDKMEDYDLARQRLKTAAS